MRKFLINVNGRSYEVEVEEIKEGNATTYTTHAPTPAPAQAPAPASAPTEPVSAAKPAASGKQGSVKIKAPMPGVIWDLKVSPGDQVKKGQVVLILEAMKMENEIMAPQDGKIASIEVSKGDSVNSGDTLITME